MNAPDRIIPAIGQTFEGGIFAGRFVLGDQVYGLVVALDDVGEHKPARWGGLKMVKAATSYNDGLTNTQAMAAAGSGLAKWAQGLELGGFPDWYLPSRLEALIAFGELQDQGVFARDWYWTSTQYAGLDEAAWSQYFTGYQLNFRKVTQLRARAVRRFLIR